MSTGLDVDRRATIHTAAMRRTPQVGGIRKNIGTDPWGCQAASRGLGFGSLVFCWNDQPEGEKITSANVD
jgi:hypothetical protein